MKFAKKSKLVTDILIPEGNVIKITEKETGKVLWEKPLKMEQVTAGLATTTLWSCFDTGSNILFFEGIKGAERYFTYNTSTGASSAIKSLKASQMYSIDMDTTSKTWLAAVNHYGIDKDSPQSYSEDLTLENSNGKLTNSTCSGEQTAPNWQHCCWMKHLNSFCVVGGSVGVGKGNYEGVCSGLVSLQHKITGFSNNCIPYNPADGFSCYQHQFCYSDTLRKAVLLTYPDYFTIRPYVSSNGTSWSNSQGIENDYKEAKVFWASTGMNAFILLAHGKKSKGDYHYCDIYKSTNGTTWTKIGVAPEFVYGLSGAWSPSKKIFLLVSDWNAYITKDFTNWTEVRYPKNMCVDDRCKAIWSESANAFIITPYIDNAGFFKFTPE